MTPAPRPLPALLLGAILAFSGAFLGPAPLPAQDKTSESTQAAQKAAPEPGTAQPLTPASRQAAEHHPIPQSGTKAVPHGGTGTPEQEKDEHAEFKQSPSVKFLARATGLNPIVAYWLSLGLNFLIVAALLYFLLRSRLPAMFRSRTEAIQKSMAEARNASEEAGRRLADIESRLSRLDAEIASMTAEAEAAARAEAERLGAATEQEKRKVVRAAEQEIAAAANLARRELKAYAAELAVSLAEKKMELTPAADQALVREFVEQLKKDGA